MKKLTPNLMVEDVDATLEWYKNILGAQEIVKIPYTKNPSKSQWALAHCGAVEFMFQLRASLEEETVVLEGVPIGGSFTLYIEVEDIKKLHDSLKSKVEVVQEMHTTFYGSQEFTIKDRNGYVLAFSQPKQN
jgi:uncharacterized glyoxalase superfamily protein PhnB